MNAVLVLGRRRESLPQALPTAWRRVALDLLQILQYRLKFCFAANADDICDVFLHRLHELLGIRGFSFFVNAFVRTELLYRNYRSLNPFQDGFVKRVDSGDLVRKLRTQQTESCGGGSIYQIWGTRKCRFIGPQATQAAAFRYVPRRFLSRLTQGHFDGLVAVPNVLEFAEKRCRQSPSIRFAQPVVPAPIKPVFHPSAKGEAEKGQGSRRNDLNQAEVFPPACGLRGHDGRRSHGGLGQGQQEGEGYQSAKHGLQSAADVVRSQAAGRKAQPDLTFACCGARAIKQQPDASRGEGRTGQSGSVALPPMRGRFVQEPIKLVDRFADFWHELDYLLCRGTTPTSFTHCFEVIRYPGIRVGKILKVLLPGINGGDPLSQVRAEQSQLFGHGSIDQVRRSRMPSYEIPVVKSIIAKIIIILRSLFYFGDTPEAFTHGRQLAFESGSYDTAVFPLQAIIPSSCEPGVHDRAAQEADERGYHGPKSRRLIEDRPPFGGCLHNYGLKAHGADSARVVSGMQAGVAA